MKTRIIARYLAKEGLNGIGDRDIHLDEYIQVTVVSLGEGCRLIKEKDLHGNGIGIIYEQCQREEFDSWEDIKKHDVDNGIIYQSEVL